MEAIKILLLGTILVLLLICGCDSPLKTDESTLWLGEANPNPMQIGESTNIDYRVVGTNELSITILNSLGQEVVDSNIRPGNGSFSWNGLDRHGRPCAEGVYYFKLIFGSQSVINKVLLIK